MFSLVDRMLSVRLGLGDLERPERCWGFGACCNCADCCERERLLDEPPRVVKRLPWEMDAAA